MPATTLLNARQGLALKLHALITGRTGIQTGTSTWVGTPIGDGAVAATRMLVSSTLAKVGRDGVGPKADLSMFDGAYVLVPSTALQRRITANGYAPAKVGSAVTNNASGLHVGYVAFESDAPAAIAADLPFEIHTLLPPKDPADRYPSLHAIINRALRVLRITRTVTIAGINNTFRYSLASIQGLTAQAQLAGIRDREYTPNMDAAYLPGNNRIRFDGGVPYLLVDASVPTGQTFYADLYFPADTWIKVGGTWGYSASGMVNETDEAAVPLDRLVNVAYFHACETLSTRDPRGQEQFWRAEMERIARDEWQSLYWAQNEIPTADEGGEPGMDSPSWLARREGYHGYGGRGWP